MILLFGIFVQSICEARMREATSKVEEQILKALQTHLASMYSIQCDHLIESFKRVVQL